MQYLGELPEQQQGNIGILTGLQTQLDNLMASRAKPSNNDCIGILARAHRRIARRALTAGVPSGGQIVTPLEAAIRDLTRLQAEKRVLATVYTPQHPDVLKKDQEIEIQRTFVNTLRASTAASSKEQEQAAEIVPSIEDDASTANIRSQLQANTFEIDNLTKKELKLRTDIERIRTGRNLTPVREQQLTSMQRDYDLLKQHYGDLLKKEQESLLSKNLGSGRKVSSFGSR